MLFIISFLKNSKNVAIKNKFNGVNNCEKVRY